MESLLSVDKLHSFCNCFWSIRNAYSYFIQMNCDIFVQNEIAYCFTASNGNTRMLVYLPLK